MLKPTSLLGQDGNQKATTAAQAAGTPFFGVFGPYTKARDPWQTPAVRSYNHYFYQKTVEYLNSRGVRNLPPFLLLLP